MKARGARLDMSPAAVSARLREVGRLSDLSPATRLDAKLDMSPRGVSSRLREVSELLALCARLHATREVKSP